MGSGAEEHPRLARPLGQWLARRGVDLLTGGGSGVMASVSQAFHDTQPRAGLVLAVLPAPDPRIAPPHQPPEDWPYPHPWVELVIRTHLPLRGPRGAELGSRNPINILTSDLVIALPGRAGTASEIQLALDYGKPILRYLESPPRPADEPPAFAAVPVYADLAALTAAVDAMLARRDNPKR